LQKKVIYHNIDSSLTFSKSVQVPFKIWLLETFTFVSCQFYSENAAIAKFKFF